MDIFSFSYRNYAIDSTEPVTETGIVFGESFADAMSKIEFVTQGEAVDDISLSCIMADAFDGSTEVIYLSKDTVTALTEELG